MTTLAHPGRRLVDDSGQVFDAHRLRTVWITWQEISEYRRQVRELGTVIGGLTRAVSRRREPTPWQRRRPTRPRQLDIFQAQKSPA